MIRDLRDSLKEWVPAVPSRWHKVLLYVIAPLIPFIIGLTRAIRQSTQGLPVPIWVWAMIIVGAVAFVLVSFLAFHRVRLERDTEQRAELKRHDLKEWRQRFSNVTRIPGLLLEMYELAKALCESNRKPLTKEQWEEIADSFFTAHQAPTVVLPIDKMPSHQELMSMISSTPDPLSSGSASIAESLNRLILNLQATMSLHNSGAIPLTDHSVLYQAKHTAVKMLQQNLPDRINAKIGECILISNGLANLLCLDLGGSDSEVSRELLVPMQYMQTRMDASAQKMRGEISAMIETFLMGG